MIVNPLRLARVVGGRTALGSTGRRSTPRRTARRALLWGAAVFVLANLGLAAALESVLPQLRDPEYGYRLARVREQRLLHPDRPLVLVMGTSRTANGFDPAATGFPDEPGSPLVFNFGLSGGGPVHLRARLAALRDDGVKPDAVLVELFLVSLVGDIPAELLCLPTANRLTSADLRRLESDLDDPATLRRAWAKSRLDPWQAQRLVIVSHVFPEMLSWRERMDHYWVNTDRLGFDRYPQNGAADLRPRRLNATRGSYSEAAARVRRPGAASDRAIRGLIADCRATGTPVAIFLTPESPTFRSWYTPESRAALAAYLQELSADLGCPVFGPPDDFTEDDFADGHHMLPAAAAKFSRYLTERHLKPWLATVR